ncbi:RHS repeat protein [Sphingobium lignivorans]|uniref:YD repeat-containing protein n=1 Tax=Sphingobium lignivorans TaxID=2735886 RepID=A0ABR6NHU1_9SPHN|nr:RHS repeat protein [Sphingobium lignivorans]MBB5986661.1 YD repeat-containing protein [Sphingobium lignivorans]
MAAIASLGSGAAVHAQPAPPELISPLQVDLDPNGLNLASGKTSVQLPVLSIPAAPRLRFQRVQDWAPYVTGRRTETAETASWSVHKGAGGAEFFKCVDGACLPIKGTGSVIESNGRQFYEGGVGALYEFNLTHIDANLSNTLRQYYASSISYADGESITISYDSYYYSAGALSRTYYRPAVVTSNTGYQIRITYQTNTGGATGWLAPAQVGIYANSAPTVALAQFTYSGGTITDLLGRVYQCSFCQNSVGATIEVFNPSSLTLPGESTAHVQSGKHASYDVVSTITKDGGTWSYAYANIAVNTTLGGYQYDKVNVTGPDSYAREYTIGVISNQKFVSSFKDELGRQTFLAYDVLLRLTGVTYPEGNGVTVTYDNQGNLTEKRTKAKPGSGLPDLVETAGYNTTGCVYAYNVLCYRPLWSRDALGRQTDYVHNSNGLVTERIDPADASGVRRKTCIAYTSAGIGAGPLRPVAEWVVPGTSACDTASNQSIRTETDYWGNTSLPSVQRRYDGATVLTTTYSYDSAGRLLSVDGPLAGSDDTVHYRYDAVGRKTWEIGPVSASGGQRLATRFTYRASDDKVTLVETGTVPDASSTAFTVQKHVTTAYDVRRNPVRETLWSGTTTYSVNDKSWDNRNRLVCSTVRMNPAAFGSLPGSACTLGPEGTNGPDRITRRIYFTSGEVRQIRKAVGTPLEQAYATYSYTNNGRVENSIDASGNRSKYMYDGYDRVSRLDFPNPAGAPAFNPSDGATASMPTWTDYELYGYDANGNRTSLRKRDGSTITFAYDALNRVIQKRVPNPAGGPNAGSSANCYSLASDTNDVCYGYDLRGRQTEVRFGSLGGWGTAYGYDGFDRLTSRTTDMGGVSRTLSYQYDAGSRRTRLTFPDGQYVAYGYDAMGRMTTIHENGSTQIAALSYNAQGARAGLTGGIATAYGYDAIGRPASLSHDLAGTDRDVTFSFTSYNGAGQLAAQSRSNDAYAWTGAMNVTRNYTSNGLNQYSAGRPGELQLRCQWQSDRGRKLDLRL